MTIKHVYCNKKLLFSGPAPARGSGVMLPGKICIFISLMIPGNGFEINKRSVKIQAFSP